MKQYLDLCRHILENGEVREDRTGTGTIGVFGYQMRFDLAKGFPLLTTKDLSGVRFDGIVEELLWFLRGETNIKTLVDKGINIWNRDAYRAFKAKFPNTPLGYKDFVQLVKDSKDFEKYGDLGKVYGKQWRSWDVVFESGHREGIDQISSVMQSLRNNPMSRRHIVSAWNVADLDQMTLPPCHVLFQFYVSNGKLSCQLYQRSADVFLGVPYNIASYALLTTMIADQVGLGYGEFVHTLGDAHIYTNHIEQVKLQLEREPKPLSSVFINPLVESIFDYKREDIVLHAYQSHPSIKGEQSA